MKITFVYPRFRKFLDDVSRIGKIGDLFTVGKFTCPPALGIPILSALTPKEFDVAFVDDNAGEEINYNDDTDLFAVSCFTPQGTRALEIARECKSRGKKVVIGGMFPSFMPDDCLAVADSVCIGEGEYVWPQLLEDLRRGELKKIYRAGKPVDMSDIPIADRNIFYSKNFYDWDEDMIQLTRGCSYGCAMCILPNHMGPRIRFRPVGEAVSEIATLRRDNIYITDDSLFFPQKSVREYAEKFFDAVAPLKKKFFVSSTLALNSDPGFLDAAARAGVANFYCTLNVDPVSIAVLRGDAEARKNLKNLVGNLKDRGINFFASFGIGRDWDDGSIADRVLDVCSHVGITTAEFFIFSPYPGSSHWNRMLSQNRITSREWEKYNGANVVFKPAKMKDEELYSQFVKCWKGFYKMNAEKNLAHMEPSVWKNGEMAVPKRLETRGVEREAAITGIGIISPIGCDCGEVLDSLRAKKDGIGAATKIDTSKFASHLCGEVKNFDYSSHMTKAELDEFADPYFRLAINAARMAIKDSAIDFAGKKVGMVLATCNGGLNSGEREYIKKFFDKSEIFDRSVSMQSEFYGLCKAMAAALNIDGECWLINTACSGSTAAIGLAESLIESGRCDYVVVGGADAVALSNYAGFNAIKVVSPDKIAPFSTPVGMNIGEGAAFWILENHASALLRKAKRYGKVIGHATTGDAHHPTQPDPRGDGAYRTMRNALENSGVPLDKIGCINAHGSGTSANDKSESKGIAKFLSGAKIPVTSTKSYTGHCMGATGIIEATCQLVSMNDNFIPPTLRYEEPRAGCEIGAVGGDGIEGEYDCFLSANYAFAGNNAAIVVAKSDFFGYEKKRRRESGRVVVTGASSVSSLGIGADNNLSALLEKKSGVAKISRFDSQRHAGLVELPNLRSYDRRLDFGGMNLISTYATIAAKGALDNADFQVKRDNCEDIGLAVSTCRGSSETAHMEGVFSDEQRRGDIACFSNVTANSTAGWVSKALEIKGANITLTSGPNSGLQTIAYAAQVVSEGAAKNMLAVAADEIYKQELDGYEQIGNLHVGDVEKDFHLNYSSYFKSVLGEGASALFVESLENAEARKAKILAEIISFSSTSDVCGFLSPNLDNDGLLRAASDALDRAAMKAEDVDLIVWSPRGCAQDSASIFVRDKMFANVPMVATSLNTGYQETASILNALVCVLEASSKKLPLWPQITGVKDMDSQPLPENPRNVLCIASSHIGNNYALILRLAD